MSNFSRPTQNPIAHIIALHASYKAKKRKNLRKIKDKPKVMLIEFLDFSLKMSSVLHLGLFRSSAIHTKSAMSYVNFGLNISFRFK
jgi:hypothetical protein